MKRMIASVEVEMTPEEITAWEAEQSSTKVDHWESIRFQRDALLKESDWTQLTDVPTKIKKDWKEYRQALRDITNQDDPKNIVWPTKPQ